MLHAYDQRFNVTRNLENFCELRPCLDTPKNKTLQDSPSHRILRHMHEVLNIDKKNN